MKRAGEIGSSKWNKRRNEEMNDNIGGGVEEQAAASSNGRYVHRQTCARAMCAMSVAALGVAWHAAARIGRRSISAVAAFCSCLCGALGVARAATGFA